jgi:hypothetical protein
MEETQPEAASKRISPAYIPSIGPWPVARGVFVGLSIAGMLRMRGSCRGAQGSCHVLHYVSSDLDFPGKERKGRSGRKEDGTTKATWNSQCPFSQCHLAIKKHPKFKRREFTLSTLVPARSGVVMDLG